jgi:hypothetical protein
VPAIQTNLRRSASFRLALSALALASLLLTPLAALAAAPITGVVTNKTTNKPSAGDTVVLIRLAQGMQESTRTTTDAHGRYTLDVPDDGLHLVRVTHDKANYFEPAPAGTQAVDLDVYNSAAHVKDVSTEAVVFRIQSDPGGNNLRVVENFFIKNDSKPPMTQFSNQPFDFYLPDGAVVEGSAALGPGGMPVQAAPVPLPEKGHYTFLFPIRPGETRFQISYQLPYSGKLTFDPKLTTSTETVAVMLAKSMVFVPGAGSPYSPVNDEVDAQTYVARSVSPQQPMSFQLSGAGQLPRDTQNPSEGQSGAAQGSAQGQAQGQGGASAGTDQSVPATDNTAPGKGLDNPLDPNGNREPWGKYKWWILSGLALLLAIGAGVLLRKPSTESPVPAPAPAGEAPAGPYPVPATFPVAPPNQRQQLLQALKEEMFALETERLQNRISETEYLEHRSALDLILRRALGRGTDAAA